MKRETIAYNDTEERREAGDWGERRSWGEGKTEKGRVFDEYYL